MSDPSHDEYGPIPPEPEPYVCVCGAKTDSPHRYSCCYYCGALIPYEVRKAAAELTGHTGVVIDPSTRPGTTRHHFVVSTRFGGSQRAYEMAACLALGGHNAAVMKSDGSIEGMEAVNQRNIIIGRLRDLVEQHAIILRQPTPDWLEELHDFPRREENE